MHWKKLPKVISSVFVFTAFALLSSCNDLPTEVGYDFLGDTVNIKVITQNDAALLYKINMPSYSPSGLNTTKIFCGKALGTTALSLIRFGNIPDTLSYLTEDNILSAEITISPKRYAYGDTVTPNFGFKLKRVENYWSVNSNLDSISTTGFFGRDIAEFSGPIKLQDTIDKIVLNLDKKLITEWFALRPDTNKAVINWGLALIPNESSNVIYTFGGEGISSTDNNPPVIKVVFNDKNNKKDSIYLYTGLNASFFDLPPFDKDDIVIQSGLDVRTNLYFDLSMIPNFSGIAKMELELTLNKNKSSFGNFKPKEFFRLDFVSDSLGATASYYYYADKVDSNSVVYKCSSITSAAELWNRFNGKGILLMRSPDFDSQFQRLDRFVFYGLNEPDSTKRPKVKVIYSTQTKK